MVRIEQVDAFTGQGLAGNPAGVCVSDKALPEVQMRRLAAAVGHSETAFVSPHGDGFAIRWFTPKEEIPLCGHATLASAAVLFRDGRVRGDEIIFESVSGPLRAFKQGAGFGLDFPEDPTQSTRPPPGLLEALGAPDASEVHQSLKLKKTLVRVKDETTVRALRPDMARLRALPRMAGVIVTAPGEAPYDFVSRFFHPWAGVDEDPVTGSAHTVLAHYWSRRLGRKAFQALQVSPRGGRLRVSLVGGGRVHLEGTCAFGAARTFPEI